MIIILLFLLVSLSAIISDRLDMDADFSSEDIFAQKSEVGDSDDD